MKKLFLILLFYTTHSLLCSPTQLSFQAPFTITGLANATTFFMHDAVSNQFVLKYHPRGPKRAIHDTLGAYIGKSIGLHINEVEIFSPHDPFNQFFSKINPLQPSQCDITTLHSRVPGTEVKSIKDINCKICIKRGLYKEKHLKSLTTYMQLCDIVAFDIFIDNTDRHNRNLFFDKKTKQFYAIDMDHGFKGANTLANTPDDYDFPLLATRAQHFICTLRKRKLSFQEIAALNRILRTLQKLITLFPPHILFEEWMSLAKKAEIHYNLREQEKIKKYLEYNAQEVCCLISLLETIF
jgi:hypothetical protein